MSSQRDPEGVEIRYLADIADLKDSRVLEVGCGDGRLTWRYAHTARSVVAVDPDGERVVTAIRNYPSHLPSTVTLAQASAQHLPFSHETFDRAILAWSL